MALEKIVKEMIRTHGLTMLLALIEEEYKGFNFSLKPPFFFFYN